MGNHRPGAEIDLAELTAAFPTARYDRCTIEEAEVRDVQRIWRKVMRALSSNTQ